MVLLYCPHQNFVSDGWKDWWKDWQTDGRANGCNAIVTDWLLAAEAPNNAIFRQVNEKLQEHIEESQAPSKLIPVIKWIVMILLGFAFLACLTASKLSLVYMGGHLMALRMSNNSLHRQGNSELVVKYRLFLYQFGNVYNWSVTMILMGNYWYLHWLYA